MSVDYVLFDLDGVIRHFDVKEMLTVATTHNVVPREFMEAVSDSDRLKRLTTGLITREQWIAEIGDVINNLAAAVQWGGAWGCIDEEVMSLVNDLRSTGLRVGIVTNGTNTVERELMQLGVLHKFDVLFNSAKLKVAKPDYRIYQMVTSSLEVAPERIFFTDDNQANVDAAKAMGWRTHRFENAVTLRAKLGEESLYREA